MISSIETLLGEFEAKVSPGVKKTVKMVKKEIGKGKVLNQLGVNVE